MSYICTPSYIAPYPAAAHDALDKAFVFNSEFCDQSAFPQELIAPTAYTTDEQYFLTLRNWDDCLDTTFWNNTLSAMQLRRKVYCYSALPFGTPVEQETRMRMLQQVPTHCLQFNQYLQQLVTWNDTLTQPLAIESNPASMTIRDWLYVEMTIQQHLAYSQFTALTHTHTSTYRQLSQEKVTQISEALYRDMVHLLHNQPINKDRSIGRVLGLVLAHNTWDQVFFRQSVIDQRLITYVSYLAVHFPDLITLQFEPNLCLQLSFQEQSILSWQTHLTAA